MGQNPYLDQQVKTAQDQTANAYATGTGAQTMAQFRNAGAFGGSAQQQYTDQQNQQLGNTLANQANSMPYGELRDTQQLAQRNIALNAQTSLADAARNAQYTLGGQQLNSQNNQYANSNMLTAAGLAPSLNQAGYYGSNQLLASGGLQQTQAQNQANAAYQNWYQLRDVPISQQLGMLQSSLSGAMGADCQGVTTSNPGSGSAMGGALGRAASGAAMGSMFGPWGTAVE